MPEKVDAGNLEPLGILETASLFPELHRELIALLRGLGPSEWDRPTLAGAWLVRDVVAHLLDGDLRKLSFQRDGHPAPQPAHSLSGYAGLVEHLNRLNAEWVAAARRLSPRLLIELLEKTGPEVALLVASLPPRQPALFPVAWAGEERSENWLDTGREYTERWHHQAQIREAVGAPGLTSRRLLRPVLELSIRALPRAFRQITSPAGSALVLQINGEAGGLWSLVRGEEAWEVFSGEATGASARASLSADTAWKLFFNALSAEKARQLIDGRGDRSLIEPLLGARAVMV